MRVGKRGMMRWLVTVLIAIVIVLVAGFIFLGTVNWAAERPGRLEAAIMAAVKYWRVGNKGLANPSPDTLDTIKEGGEHFQHHCQICHGLDGQGTGVPIVTLMSPPVADLASARVQRYTDGQLKWIIDNGIRFSGMPGWRSMLSDDEAWAMVRYIRHLPTKGSLGPPKVFEEAEEQHEHGAESKGEQSQPADHHHSEDHHRYPQ